MLIFIIVLVGLISLAVLVQLFTNMKLIGGNELGIVSGGGKKGFKTLSGGRIFIIPILNKFAKIDLTPHTIEVVVDSAIAEGIIPLNVKATVSFGIASNEAGRGRAVTRILNMTHNWAELRTVASDIIEGHLRDAIATMTPEQVMQDKDTLVARLINVCKSDLENIGLEITTMNIADVDDHRLEGVEEPDLYIALLKRVQTANAVTQARQAQAHAKANSIEQEEERRCDTELRAIENEYQDLVARTQVLTKSEEQRNKVGVEQASRQAFAKVAGIKAEIASEKQRIEMLKNKYKAEIIVPAQAEKEKMIMGSKQEAARFVGKAQGEIDELEKTLSILAEAGESGRKTYIIENFQSIISSFSETLSYFPVDKLSVITGTKGEHKPISAIHPNAVEEEKNKIIAGAISQSLAKQNIE